MSWKGRGVCRDHLATINERERSTFSAAFDQEGDYHLSKMTYRVEGDDSPRVIDCSSLSDNGYFFAVVSEDVMAVLGAENDEDISVLSVSDDGSISTASSVQEGLEKAAEESPAGSAAPLMARSSASSTLVVVIDPGHGGRDSGATGYGLLEKDVNLSIASHMRDELNQYAGVSVVMTRDGDYALGDTTEEDLAERVEIAKRAGADVFVSIHINSGGGTGSEVWVPNGASYNYESHTVGVSLGGKIAQQLADLGLKLRGRPMGCLASKCAARKTELRIQAEASRTTIT